MKGTDIATITRINRNTNSPRLDFYAEWLGAIGFVSRALVQYIPEIGGMTFTLCDENILRYSELYRHTKEKGGTLMQVFFYRDGLQLCISGARLNATGLVFGDKLLVRYEPGIVRMRKLPQGAVKLVTTRINGKWLGEAGFVPGAVLSVRSTPGLITCTLHENGVERTAELVKYARANRLQLLQVQQAKYLKRSRKLGVYSYFDLPKSCIKKAGFDPDDVLLATYEHGIISLQKPDFAELGF